MRISSNVECLTCSETTQHHTNFRLWKVWQIVFDITTSNVNITLCKETEDVCQELFFFSSQCTFPVLNIFSHWHFSMKPVCLFMFEPCFICPWIIKWFEIITLFSEVQFTCFFLWTHYS